MAWEWRTTDSVDMVIKEPCRLKQVVVSFTSTPTGAVVLRNGVTDTSGVMVYLNSASAGTVSLVFEEPLPFGVGMYVDLPSSSAVVHVLIERTGHD
jgi:uracil phosphoribosyltransferase